MLTGTMTNRRSNAKNAYDLMSDIKAYILEEPKRVYMGDWMMGNADFEHQFGIKGPVCGTVGCIAGNTLVLVGKRESLAVCWNALEILGGYDYDLRHALEYELFLDTEVKADYGTKKYARIVAKCIEQFQTEHEQALRAVGINQNDRK